MQDIFSLIFFILTMLMLGASIYANVILFIDNTKLKANLNQSILDNDIIGNKLYESVANKNVEGSEGFLKFVTQSRDWAFEYIESVQSALTDFVETVGPTMEYYDKFGRINETPSMNTVFEAYIKLIKILPETNEKQGETK